MNILGMIGLEGIGGGIVASKLLDYCVSFKHTPQGKAFAKQRELQLELAQKQKDFQWELEYERMSFQEQMEMKRMKFQKNLQTHLAELNMKNSREIAMFQAQAARQTQILMARENARNLLQDHLMQKALETYPLNVSPLVILKNQPQSLSSLLRFTESGGDKTTSIQQVYEEVMDAAKHPEALNIFVAPVYVDPKIRNRKVLSDQIWATVYQRIESFFTENYNRNSDHPVIFFPTAWNDKYNPGMHASETLHFFLKDVPCVVIEPRFDGTTFRLMFSSWGIGYNTTVHNRTELNFPINIDVVLANAVYERSVKALNAIKEIDSLLDANALGFKGMRDTLQRNIDLYQALHIEKRMAEKRMDEIDALDIYNVFKVEPLKDLNLLADVFSAYIGLNLAALADIHHLRSVDVEPLLPKLLKTYFPELCQKVEIRKSLAEAYEETYRFLRKEEAGLKAIEGIRELQFERVKKQLELSAEKREVSAHQSKSNNTIEKLWKEHMKGRLLTAGEECENFDKVVNLTLNGNYLTRDDIPFFENLLKSMDASYDKNLRRRLGMKLFELKNKG